MPSLQAPPYFAAFDGGEGGGNAGSFCRNPEIVESPWNARSNLAVTPNAPKAEIRAVSIEPVVVASGPVAVPTAFMLFGLENPHECVGSDGERCFETD